MFVRFDYSAGYCGTEDYEFGKFEDTTTDKEINEIALQLAEQHCENYVDIEYEEESGVEWEYDYSWKIVEEKEVEQNNCTDYTK